MRILLFLSVFLVSFSLASIGKITSFKGSVTVERDGKGTNALLGYEINKNDVISTKANSNVIIRFEDDTIVTVGKDSVLNIEEYLFDKTNPDNSKTKFNFLKGSFKAVTGTIGHLRPEKFKLLTKSANIGIRGTVTLGNQKLIACTKGSVSVSSKGNSVVLEAGQFTNVLGQAPTIPEALTADVLRMLLVNLGLRIEGDNDNGGESRSSAVKTMVSTSMEKVSAKASAGGSSGGGSCGSH